MRIVCGWIVVAAVLVGCTKATVAVDAASDLAVEEPGGAGLPTVAAEPTAPPVEFTPPVLVTPRTGRAAHLVVALDVSGSFERELPLVVDSTRRLVHALGLLQGPDDRVGMVVFYYRFALLWTPLTRLHGEPGEVVDLAMSWSRIETASRIRAQAPFASDQGPRPHMPREYDGEQGTDHSVALAFAREVLVRETSPEDYRAIVLITDGQPINLRPSQVRDEIGYVETRWEVFEGPAPHTIDEIKTASVAIAQEGWAADGIHVWVVSLREANDFMRLIVQGDGEFFFVGTTEDLDAALQQIADTLPRSIQP